MFMVSYENAANVAINTVTYGGQALTRINGTVAGTTTFSRVELWYLRQAQIVAATNTTFVVTYGGTAPTIVQYAAATYRNVDQTTPILANSVNQTNAATPNPLTTAVTVTSDGMSVAAVTSGNVSTFTWNNGWTEGTDASTSSSAASTADHFISANGTDTASAHEFQPKPRSHRRGVPVGLQVASSSRGRAMKTSAFLGSTLMILAAIPMSVAGVPAGFVDNLLFTASIAHRARV